MLWVECMVIIAPIKELSMVLICGRNTYRKILLVFTFRILLSLLKGSL